MKLMAPAGVRRLRWLMLRRIAPDSGSLARRLRHPWPLFSSWRQDEIHLVRGRGVGDVLMCTPVLRELKLRRPNSKLLFYTEFPSLVRGLPYVDHVGAPEAAPPSAWHLQYESAVPTRAHLSQILGDGLGLPLRDTRPDCIADPISIGRFRAQWRDHPRPHVIVNRRASGFTPNKDWPQPSWDELIRRLSRRGTVIEVGAASTVAESCFGPGYVDLRGRTSLDEMVAAIAAADLHVGPPSGPVHIAAAMGKRSVVIVGGYEGPTNTAYPTDMVLSSSVPCAPCWLNSSCPHDRKCLSAISPAEVEAAVWTLWNVTRP